MGFYEDMLANGAITEAPMMLPKARKRRSAGDVVTQTVKSDPVLPMSLRQMSDDFTRRGLDAYNAEPDLESLQNYAKQRSGEGDSAMLNAMAAQYAGKDFEPVQAQFLKRALAAQEPMKVGNAGYMTPQGQFVKDPAYANDRRAETYLRLGQQYSSQAEQEQAAKDRNETQRLLYSLRNAPGDMGAGASTQIGSDASGAPVFRHSKQGYLFQYGEDGQPKAYAGQVLPKVTNSQPSEDERKAAGWFVQAENGVKNMAKAMQMDPNASVMSLKERGYSMVPGIGDDLANNTMTAPRQMFTQAASSMAEALLRAATGAGVNDSEQKQKLRELIPQWGDKQEKITQKMESYRVYMGALQARAGRALQPALNSIQQAPQPAPTGDEVIDLPSPGRR